MKKISIVLFAVLLSSCFNKELIKQINPQDFNYINATQLARYQTTLLGKYKNSEAISDSEIKVLENDVWVEAAAHLAPGNLVVRQWALIDLIKNSSEHSFRIYSQLMCLSYGKLIWAEGYTYFLYTREILDVWSDKFHNDSISNIIAMCDNGFTRTAYKRGKYWYPAPFGDVRDVPLAQSLQAECDSFDHESCEIGPVIFNTSKGDTAYSIYAKPLGMNHHIPKSNMIVVIKDGIPVGYTFYTWIENKYKSKVEEDLDVYDPSRLKTIQKGECECY